MRILVISDTHTDSIEKLPSALVEEAKLCGAIIHAGDIVSFKLINELMELCPLIYPVKGNMDPYFNDERLPEKRLLEFDGVKIGVAHGTGNPVGIENRLLYTFQDADIIVFGHTHKPFWGQIGGIWFLNPGSPTNKRTEPFHTFAVLNIDNGTFSAEIIRI